MNGTKVDKSMDGTKVNIARRRRKDIKNDLGNLKCTNFLTFAHTKVSNNITL